MKNRLNKEVFILAVRKSIFIGVLVCSMLWGGVSIGAMTRVDTVFLYTLSNFNSPIPSSFAKIHVDDQKNEIYVLYAREKDIRIFNETGMEIYRFGDDGSLGAVVDVAVKKDGTIMVLSNRGLKSAIILCNYRGEPLSELALKNLPPDFLNFVPDRMAYREGRLYLLDSSGMRIAVTDANGFFENGYDIAALLEIEEKKRGDTEIGGFSVDREGNMLFTIPVLFLAYTLSPDGKFKGFGVPGGAPGKFNLVGGIVADDRGNYYVADRLKCAVLIFDKNFRFLKEFGYRGPRPENLFGPNNLVLDTQGRLYVSQSRNRGISVFKINFPQSETPEHINSETPEHINLVKRR